MVRTVLLVAVSLTLIGCGGAPTTSALSEAERKAKEAAEAAGDAAKEAREKMRQEARQKVEQFDDQLKAWKTKVDDATG